MAREYIPDNWVLVDLTTPSAVIRKVFAGWYGGYTSGDSWKLSSEVVKVTDNLTHYEFLNISGSVYKCYKSNERLSGYMATLLSSWQTDIIEADSPFNIEVVHV